jgi:hypothetical protein
MIISTATNAQATQRPSAVSEVSEREAPMWTPDKSGSATAGKVSKYPDRHPAGDARATAPTQAESSVRRHALHLP